MISGVAIHYVWAGVGLIPPAGEAGGTAPGGYTTYLNVAFTLLFLGQVYVGYVTDADAEAVGESHTH